MATVTFFHAHPDDEAIATGGTMASLADQGHRVVLVTATGGELGEVPDGLLDPGETLAERRAAELAEAARILGVARQRLPRLRGLGHGGRGVERPRPGCFATADTDEAADRLAELLGEEGSDVLVTYDEHGGYGHPDHVQVHRVGMAAAERAGTPVVYMATMDRDFMRGPAHARRRDSELGPEDELEGADTMGEPAERITTELDVGPVDRRQARRHAGPRQPDRRGQLLPAHARRRLRQVWGQEWYVRVRPEPVGLGDGVREPGLVARLRRSASPAAPRRGGWPR